MSHMIPDEIQQAELDKAFPETKGGKIVEFNGELYFCRYCLSSKGKPLLFGGVVDGHRWEKLYKSDGKQLIRRCPSCGSIWVCWNMMHACGGDREAYERGNPDIPPSELKDWGHECWECEYVHETDKKVYNGLPYWFLRRFYRGD